MRQFHDSSGMTTAYDAAMIMTRNRLLGVGWRSGGDDSSWNELLQVT